MSKLKWIIDLWCFCQQGAPGKDGDVGAPGPSGVAVRISSDHYNMADITGST